MKLWYKLGQCLINVGSRVLFGLRVEGGERVPSHGGVIIAPNHLSYLDPPLVGSALLKRELHYLAKGELFASSKFFSWLIRNFQAVPIGRDGFSIEGFKRLLQLLKKGEAVCIFPEGTRSKDGNILPPKRGFGHIVLKSGMPVVPTLVKGTNRGLKNLLLRRERLVVRFGNPIFPEELEEIRGSSDPYLGVGRAVVQEIKKLDS